ncbi:peptidylprolyl isomerase [Mucilaginibacter ginsenosidivorans]|uniref:Periplasmic chaperone PpiD n=1 Tax=Mucilaginibacter ginsenosidivorans TaxID=398053 RepID=A0A5B8UQZ6_9SPHI|nr:peptidylprolyl isomerase [Mucilaginibacter ginsenosidivorans]QEC61115.1 peptidylprolyl isomerase [Mucilaginibacter ginsenosidivorans]
MGVMNYLRERMGKIVAIVIGASLLAFILGEVLRSGSSFFKGDSDALGEVAGEKISYKNFQAQVEQAKQQSGQTNLSGQFTSYLEEMTWNQDVSRVILNKEIDKLGLVVTVDETNSMVNGNNPDPQILQYFGDPKTGKVDQVKFNNFKASINAAKADDPMKIQWVQFLEQLGTNKLAQKYISATSNGMYVNSLDAKDDYENKNKLANFKYVTLDYASIPDNKVTLTDDDYQSYYNDHQYQFKNKQETRSFDYVSFSAAPSKDDSAAVKGQIEKLVPELKSTTNDSLFIQINAETKAPLAYKRKGQLGDPQLDSVMFNQPNGFVYGPYFSNGSYKIAKLIDSKVGPDSVKARHILLPIGADGEAAARAKADSLKKLIQAGKSFDELAKTYSIDKQSGEKGGDLGTFGRGAMVAEFDNAAFDGKKGELQIVKTQFGIHLLQIEEQKGSSKAVEVAVIDKPVTASTKTQSTAFSNAQKFLGALTKDNFDAEVKKEGLIKKTATDVQALASSFQGVDDARQLVRWAFKADKGDLADQVYVAGDQYIVPVLTEIKPKGTLPLDAVKKQIEGAVRNHVKAKQLLDKFQAAENGASTIDQVAQKVSASAVPVQNIVFANPVIPGLSLEYKVVGTVFGSKPNKLSKPIEGEHGVFVFSLDNFINPAPLANAVREREQIGQALAQRSQSALFDALKDKANVKDYRSKFL